MKMTTSFPPVNRVRFMKGYYKQQEETQKTLRGGWLHTGDMGYMDDDGYLFITDRIKDMIIKGGYNIYPSEIEGYLEE
ncbi:MAG: AMP-binding protein, partial [Deltaproteobacteria bacterium]|nr:AMP-binding protein [Deltaproteobacteria bacterium]